MLHRFVRPLRLVSIPFALLAAYATSLTALRADVSGFGTTGTGFSLNSGVTVASNVVTLTNGASQARSIFYNTPQAITGFNVSFTYTESAVALGSGAAFVLQKATAGAGAVNQSGTLLGGISPAAAVELNLTSVGALTLANSSYAYANSGGSGTTPAGSTLGLGGAGDPLAVTLHYGGTTLSETIKDTVNNASATYNYTVGDLTSVLGGSTAYMGFTGMTGSLSGPTQTISGFAFTAVPEPAAWGSVVAGGLSVLTAAALATACPGWTRVYRRRSPPARSGSA